MHLVLRPLLVGTIGLIVTAAGCRSVTPPPSPPRYIVTTAPLDVAVGSGLCVAVAATAPRGVWWWQPGDAGCASRSTGPGVFDALDATVGDRTESGAIEVRFRVPLHFRPGSTMPPFADVRLTIQNGTMQAAATGARVTTTRRNDLDLPARGPL